MTRAAGWDPFDAAGWPEIAAALPKPWPAPAVRFDLRWWAARERTGQGFRPGRPALVFRYGWTDRRVRDLMADPEQWEDPAFPAGRARVQPTSSRRPADVQPTSRTATVEPYVSADNVQPTSSRRPAYVQSTSTRALVLTDTDHTSQITETIPTAWQEPDTATDPSPIPGHPALTLALPQKAEPTDRPVTTEPTEPPHPPSRRAPPPRRGTGATPDEAAAVLAMLGAWSEIGDDAAADARRAADPSSGTWAQLLRAVRDPRIGADRLVRRYRSVARSGGRSSAWVRSVVAGKDRMKPATICGWHGGTNASGRPVLEAGLDDEAQAWADTPEGAAALAEPTPDGWQHKRARSPDGPGAVAWAAMTALQRWRDGGSSGPNLAGDFGKPGRWDLAGDAVEHDRRRAAMGVAGGWAAWTGDATEAGRARYRAAWVKAYEGVAP